MKRLICAVVALGVSGSALAWGEREQGALVGAVVGALIAKERVGMGYAQGYGYGQVGYGSVGYGQVGQLGPVGQLVCRQIPVVDQYGRHVGWTQQCAVRY